MFSQQDKVRFQYDEYGSIFKNWGKDKEYLIKDKLGYPISEIYTLHCSNHVGL